MATDVSHSPAKPRPLQLFGVVGVFFYQTCSFTVEMCIIALLYFSVDTVKIQQVQFIFVYVFGKLYNSRKSIMAFFLFVFFGQRGFFCRAHCKTDLCVQFQVSWFRFTV